MTSWNPDDTPNGSLRDPSAAEAAHWQPLIAAVGLASVEAESWMFMGSSKNPDGQVIFLYKHRDTRRYLNLDDKGNAYRYGSRKDGYILMNKAVAIQHAIS